MIKNNGLIYTFSKAEVEAVSDLIKWATEYKGKKAEKTVTKVAKAFNRPYFEGKFIKKHKK